MPLTIVTDGDRTLIGESLIVEQTLPLSRPNEADPEGDPEIYTEFRVYRLEEVTDPIELANRVDPFVWALKSAHPDHQAGVNAALALLPEA